MTNQTKLTITHIKDIASIVGLIVAVIALGVRLSDTVKANTQGIIKNAYAIEIVREKFDDHCLEGVGLKKDIEYLKKQQEDGIKQIKELIKSFHGGM